GLVPCEVALVEHGLGDLLQTEAPADAFEHAAMDQVELDELDLARAHLVHAGLILRTPGVRESEPVVRIAERLEDAFGLARNAVAPIDHGAEYVEHQGLDRILDLRLRALRPGLPPTGESGANERAGGRERGRGRKHGAASDVHCRPPPP